MFNVCFDVWRQNPVTVTFPLLLSLTSTTRPSRPCTRWRTRWEFCWICCSGTERRPAIRWPRRAAASSPRPASCWLCSCRTGTVPRSVPCTRALTTRAASHVSSSFYLPFSGGREPAQGAGEDSQHLPPHRAQTQEGRRANFRQAEDERVHRRELLGPGDAPEVPSGPEVRLN